MARARTKIVVVDDHPLVREWLSGLVGNQDDLVVCGEAGDAAQAQRLICAAKPDVAIVDISLGSGSGLELIRTLKDANPGLAIIVLSMHDEKLYAERAIRAGARGYIMKSETTANIVSAVRHVASGKVHVSPSVAALFAEKFIDRKSAGRPPIERLSDRELEIFRLLGEGLGTHQIADNLHLSIKTVQGYCGRIKEKLQLKNGTELLREAILFGENRVPEPRILP